MEGGVCLSHIVYDPGSFWFLWKSIPIAVLISGQPVSS
jgi:hypothetical protein